MQVTKQSAAGVQLLESSSISHFSKADNGRLGFA